MSKADFVSKIYQAGLAAGLTDAAARVMASQAAIESSYGERAPGYNYFAITKGDQWTGPTIKRTDKDGKGNPIQQEFRAYESPEAGLADRVSFMDSRFPGFNQAGTVDEALAALQNGVKGKYYEAPQDRYENTVKGIEKKYLADIPSAPSHPVPKADVPFSPNTFLGGKQYGAPSGGVGVNADRLHPEFANRMAALVQAAEDATGVPVQIFEGYRDPKRQAQLRANYLNAPVQWEGATYQPNGKGYKAAPPGASQHQLGMATDIRTGPEPDKFPSGPAFDYMREHAADYGLHWFGSSDPAHFEMPDADYKAAVNGKPVPQFKLPKSAGARTAVASELSVTAPPPLPRPRPEREFDPLPFPGPLQAPRPDTAAGRVLGASFGDRGAAADSVTPRLGWENGEQSWNGREARQIIPSADNARARLAAGNILGGAADDQMRSLGMPARNVPAPTMQPGMLGRSSVPPPVAAPTLDETRAEQSAMRRVAPTSTAPTVVVPTSSPSPIAPVQVATATPPAAAAPSGGNILGALGGGINFLGSKAQELGSTLGNTAVQARDAVVSGASDMADKTVDAIIPQAMQSLKVRSAIIDPLLARGFTDKPGYTIHDSPGKYGKTQAERQEAAAKRQALMDGRPYVAPMAVRSQTDTSPSVFSGPSGRTYTVGRTYNSSRGPVIATANGFQPAGSATRPSARQSRSERFTNLDSFGNII